MPSWIRIEFDRTTNNDRRTRVEPKRSERSSSNSMHKSRTITKKGQRLNDEPCPSLGRSEAPPPTKLLELARSNNWQAACQQCQVAPSEAIPRRLQMAEYSHQSSIGWTYSSGSSSSSSSPSSGSSRASLMEQSPSPRQNIETNPTISSVLPKEEPMIYEETALGILCANFSKTGKSEDYHSILDVASAIVQACPVQVRCSQQITGYTPLRAALCNLDCPVELLRLLLQTDQRDDWMLQNTSSPNIDGGDESCLCRYRAVDQMDPDGLLPIDHMIRAVHHGLDPLAMEKLQVYVQEVQPCRRLESIPPWDRYHGASSTPLLQLLSMGTSFGPVPVSKPIHLSVLNSPQDQDRLDRIFVSTKRLLQWDPTLLEICSGVSGCSPLHMAIRNYGNFIPLIQDMAQRDDATALFRHANHFGDLPIHVACTVGVPLDVLRLILARTLEASPLDPSCLGGPDSLIWSCNDAGYTPVDLEWMRHLEAGNGFFSHRSFYPVDIVGMHRHSGRCREVYEHLLRQAVEQVSPESRNALVIGDVLANDEDQAFGLLLHRILLVIITAFRNPFPSFPDTLTKEVLHHVTVISGPVGPVLPKPILDLIRRQYPEQLQQKDRQGRFPLHLCFTTVSRHDEKNRFGVREDVVRNATAWKSWVFEILKSAPAACRVPDSQGRLPFHFALACVPDYDDETSKTCLRECLGELIGYILDVFPDSTNIIDPVTNLYPAFLAAMNPYITLDLLFRIVKRTPEAFRHCGVSDQGPYRDGVPR